MARSPATAPPNTLYYGDNLDVLRRHVPDASVDLVYLDPLFNSNADYNAFFAEKDGTQSAAQIKAFEDTWRWDAEAARTFDDFLTAADVADRPKQAMDAFRRLLGPTDMLAYLAMMAPRLVELHRALKPTGSLYLHCDPTASHYLKLLLDAIFGPTNFRNEIIWKRHNARKAQRRWPRIHDTLLYCTKSDDFTFAPTLMQADHAKMPHTLITGPDGQKYQTYELTAPGTRNGPSGKPWKGYDPASLGRHWGNYELMDGWDVQGLIHWPKKEGGFPRRRSAEPFDPSGRQITIGDVWTDIDRINQSAKELLGYPTQKPVALLERIVAASSNEGDVVLDPFCGCGTTIAAAHKLNRRWVGIDVTALAITLIKSRLRDTYGPDVAKTYRVVGEPTVVEEAEQLAKDDPYQFQWWALGLVGARPVEQKKGADKGIDGRLYFHDTKDGTGAVKQAIFSVKAGSNLSVPMVRDLVGVLDREKASVGVLLTMHEPTKPMRTEAADAGFYTSPYFGTRHPRVQILTVGELLAGKQVDMPAVRENRTFKRAAKAKGPANATPSLPIPGAGEE